MKSSLRCTALGFCLFWSTTDSFSAVIQTPGNITVDGIINGSSGTPFEHSDTLDYLKFEVLGGGSITFTSGFSTGMLLQLGEHIGRNDEFGFVGDPYQLQQISITDWDSMTRPLDPGIYVAIMGARLNTSYDIFDGFDPVNSEGGGFSVAPYGYSIAGNVRALEFWDGELNNTFIITTFIPEPSAVALAAIGAGLCLRRRRTRS